MAIREQISLATITRREVDGYAADAFNARLYAVLDDEHQTYAVIIVPEDPKLKPERRNTWIVVFARVVNDYVIIEEDSSLDKPLVDALMINGGVPREKIVLAYKGEKLPDQA
jgi:hypothetical protein